jgi:AraC family transcriptional regulator, regulatory protein of adaptative response / methylated-DNA-[protein]-cysteine methyltransferase
MSLSHNIRHPMTTDAQRWQAIRTRDASADGVFCYGTLSTRVFCRPSCASRPARRTSVEFFDSTDTAVAAGCRPCKRCKPLERRDPLAVRLEAVARHIAANAAEGLPMARLATMASLSPTHFQRVFKAHFGVTPRAYQDGLRLSHLRKGLRKSTTVLEAITSAGYSSASRVYGEAARHLGMTPSAYRAGGARESISYACRQTSLGPLMMAATAKGVCFAEFGESAAALLAKLGAEFPAATLEPSPQAGAEALDAWMQAFARHLDGNTPRPDIPLDLRGTAFQVRVWRFLLGLAPGEIVSYTELAQAIGAPKAVRAAASACGADRIAVLIPCHRVLRGDGGLGGYRWGLDRKRTLIDQERALARGGPR